MVMEIKDRLFVGRKKNDVDEKYDLRHRLQKFQRGDTLKFGFVAYAMRCMGINQHNETNRD